MRLGWDLHFTNCWQHDYMDVIGRATQETKPMDAAAKPTGKYLRRVRKMKIPTELTEIADFFCNARVVFTQRCIFLLL